MKIKKVGGRHEDAGYVERSARERSGRGGAPIGRGTTRQGDAPEARNSEQGSERRATDRERAPQARAVYLSGAARSVGKGLSSIT